MSVIRLVAFLVGAFFLMQAAIFSDEYGNSLRSHLIESKSSFELFQKDADKYFGGDVPALILHYKRNGDPVFYDGGLNVEAIYKRYTMLKEAFDGYQGWRIKKIWQLALFPISDVRAEVGENFPFDIRLNTSHFLFGLIGGLACWALVELGAYLLRGNFSE